MDSSIALRFSRNDLVKLVNHCLQLLSNLPTDSDHVIPRVSTPIPGVPRDSDARVNSYRALHLPSAMLFFQSVVSLAAK